MYEPEESEEESHSVVDSGGTNGEVDDTVRERLENTNW